MQPRDGQPPVIVEISVPWIDTHIHLRAGDGSYGEAIKSAHDLLRSSGAVGAILMAQPFPEVANQNKHDVAEIKGGLGDAAPWFDFLGGGGSLNGTIEKTPPDRVTEEIKARFAEQARKILDAGAAGFGEIALLHLSHFDGHPFEEVQPDHPLMLLLADIAAERGKVIDIHMDVVPRSEPTPAKFSSPPNPAVLRPNLEAFERLLAHNRKAKFVLAHAGWDVTGHWDTLLTREMLSRNANLYTSIKILPTAVAQNMPIRGPNLKPEWLALVKDFPDRFTIGTDSFFASSRSRGQGTVFRLQPIQIFLEGLPRDLAELVGWKNAVALYGLKIKKE